MKKANITASVLSAFAASAVLAASAGAYLTVAESPSEYLNSDRDMWQFLLSQANNDLAYGLSKLQFVVTFDGDAAEYEKEKLAGSYDNADAKPFADFEGHVGIGALLKVNGTENNWYELGYKTLSASQDNSKITIDKLDDTTYLFSCDISDIEILPTDRDIQLMFKDWGNKSDYYTLTVREFYAYQADGSVSIYADGNGNPEFGTHAAFDPSVYGPAPEETTAATTTAAPETTTTTLAETTTTATTTAAATTTTEAAVTTQTAGTVQQTGATDYGSRDSSLLVVGIIAGVLIIGVIVGIIVYNKKRRRNHWKEGL